MSVTSCQRGFQIHQFESFVYHVGHESNPKLKAQHQLIFIVCYSAFTFWQKKEVSVVTTWLSAVFSLPTGGGPLWTSLGSVSVSAPAEQSLCSLCDLLDVRWTDRKLGLCRDPNVNGQRAAKTHFRICTRALTSPELKETLFLFKNSRSACWL